MPDIRVPDIRVAGRDGGPYDLHMEQHVARLEPDMREGKSELKELRTTTIRIGRFWQTRSRILPPRRISPRSWGRLIRGAFWRRS
jgi:hypothetical protein